MDADGSRDPYLLRGRRIQVRDLVAAGLLAPGQRLVFRRPRRGTEHRARITDDSRIEIEGGEVFDTPSRSARVASGMGAVDGWRAWEVEETGELLDTVRQRYLDLASDAGETPMLEADLGGSKAAARARHERLRQARAKAERGQPEQLTVGELVGLWGATSRSADVESAVQDELANHGLHTEPDFRKVLLSSSIHMVISAGAAEGDGPEVDGEDGPDRFTGGLTIGNLPSASGGVVSIAPDGSLEQAVTNMLMHGFSQLPVMSGSRNLRGAVTWRSIAQALQRSSAASLATATVRATSVSFEDELIEVLPTLRRDEFVFVVDRERAISGIVTSMDVVDAYGEMAGPFFLIGEIDVTVRRIIDRHFTLEEVEAVCGHDRSASGSPLRPTIGSCQRVLESVDGWARLGWPIDRRMFVAKLDEIRAIRNNLMHFNPDPLDEKDVDGIRNFVDILRTYEEMGS